MLNEVAIEGHVIGNSWRWSGDTLFRVGVDRDLPRGRKGSGPRDGSDYITVRAPAQALAGVPVDFREGLRVRVHGFVQSREYTESLRAYLARANGSTHLIAVTDVAAEQVSLNRVATEIVAERIIFVREKQKTATDTPAASRSRRARQAPAAPANQVEAPDSGAAPAIEAAAAP